MDPQTATEFVAGLAVIITAGLAAYLHLLPMVQAAITATTTMLHEVGALKTAAAVHESQIAGHATALNGGMTERIQGIVAHQLLQAGIVTAPARGDPTPPGPVVAVPDAPPGGPLAARIAALQAELDAARGAA